MPRPGQRVVLSLSLILGLILVTLVGLNFHIKTITMNSELSFFKQELQVLEVENRQMEVQILSESTLENVEKRAKEMGLEPTRVIDYIRKPALGTGPLLDDDHAPL